MDSKKHILSVLIKTAVGTILFSLGFNLFLVPNGLNAGGLTGLSMVIAHLTNFDGIGLITVLLNLPLFALAGLKIGKKFFWFSLFGMIFMSVSIDVLDALPKPDAEPLIGAIYGGIICGLGLGTVFSTGATTGGTDIVVRLLKLRWRDVPIGVINIALDLSVAVLTGVVFGNLVLSMYSGIAIFITGRVIDAVVYRFDYSKVAMIITKNHTQVVSEIHRRLDSGATYLHGEGTYTNEQVKVILTALKRQQLAELKELVVEIDPDAFIIVQEAHQVLGEGFRRYSKDEL